MSGLQSNCLSWAKGIISQILQTTTSDLRVPLNYRGIILLPVIAEMFSGVMAARVGDLLEKIQRLANKQNGFRPDRSCLDDVFTLNNILRIRKSK